ncbi:hypothetical protein Tco_1319024 [Tanacetum coccineum]
MKMEHYLAHTDYPIWEVIQNGNGPVSITTDTSGQIKVLPPRTAEEIVAREKERKARTTLLMALPEDHLAKFHKMTNAKEMWDAIKSRFGGNDESKKMQKYILKQQFKDFSVSNSEGLHQKGYDGFQSLLKMDLKWPSGQDLNEMKKFYKTVEKLQFDAKELSLPLIKPKWNVTIATRQAILLESVESRELKITGGGMHGILETRMGAELDRRRILSIGTDDGEGVIGQIVQKMKIML